MARVGWRSIIYGWTARTTAALSTPLKIARVRPQKKIGGGFPWNPAVKWWFIAAGEASGQGAMVQSHITSHGAAALREPAQQPAHTKHHAAAEHKRKPLA